MFLFDNNLAKMVAVTVGNKIGDLVQVSGVKPGDKIVLAPSEKIKDGAVLAVIKK